MIGAVVFLGLCGLLGLCVAISGVGSSIKSTKPDKGDEDAREAANKAWAKECEARRVLHNQCATRVALAAEQIR